MISYFRKGFKPSIKVKIEQQDWESIDFEEMVQKAVNAEAKAGLKSSTMVRNLDICYSRGHRLSNSTASKVQTQRTTAKDSHPEELKVKKTRLTPSWAKASELSKQARKKKKKKKHQKKRDKDQTPASTANAMKVQQKKKKNQDQDVSKVTCFNYNKKGYYTSIYTKSSKN